MTRRNLVLPTLFCAAVGLGAMLLSLFVLDNVEERQDIIGVFAPLAIGQIALAIGVLCLDGLIFGTKQHSGAFVLWSLRTCSAACLVIIGLGLWHATWPYHLAAIVPLAAMVVVLRASRHVKPGSPAALADAERRRKAEEQSIDG